jgi:hypothetical protein
MPCQGHGTTKDENRAEPPGDLGFYFRTNPPCPAFWGVAPPKMKMALIDSKAYFRINLLEERYIEVLDGFSLIFYHHGRRAGDTFLAPESESKT